MDSLHNVRVKKWWIVTIRKCVIIHYCWKITILRALQIFRRIIFGCIWHQLTDRANLRTSRQYFCFTCYILYDYLQGAVNVIIRCFLGVFFVYACWLCLFDVLIFFMISVKWPPTKIEVLAKVMENTIKRDHTGQNFWWWIKEVCLSGNPMQRYFSLSVRIFIETSTTLTLTLRTAELCSHYYSRQNWDFPPFAKIILM